MKTNKRNTTDFGFIILAWIIALAFIYMVILKLKLLTR